MQSQNNPPSTISVGERLKWSLPDLDPKTHFNQQMNYVKLHVIIVCTFFGISPSNNEILYPGLNTTFFAENVATLHNREFAYCHVISGLESVESM